MRRFSIFHSIFFQNFSTRCIGLRRQKPNQPEDGNAEEFCEWLIDTDESCSSDCDMEIEFNFYMCESCLSPDSNGGMTCEEWFDSNNHEGDGEGLLQESEYGYTVTGSNDAGESSEGHTVRLSGGAEEFFDGRDSRAEETTGDNADPVARLANVASPDGTNLAGEGHYEIPHNFDLDENRIEISIDGSASDDDDYPYGIDRYKWT